MRAVGVSGAIALAVLALTGQAAATHTGLLFGAPSRVVVVMTEYRFTPSTITVEAGTPVDIVLENKGIISHSFMVYSKPKSILKGVREWHEYAMARTYIQDVGEILVHRRGQFAVAGTSISEVALEPGERITLTFTPKRKGRFEIGCHLRAGAGESHYNAGMKGLLIVK